MSWYITMFNVVYYDFVVYYDIVVYYGWSRLNIGHHFRFKLFNYPDVDIEDLPH